MDENSRNQKKSKKIIYDIIILILSLILIASVAYMVKYFIIDRKKVIDDSANLKEMIVDDDYSKLLEINPGFVGWLTIPNTHVDLPVTKYSDNKFYLRHNFYKEYDFRGNPFIDYRSDVLSFSNNTVIYGHNCHDGTIFSDLEKYLDLDFYKESPVIEFNTIYTETKWKIFAVIVTSASEDEDNGYVFPFNYPDMSGINYEGYIAELMKRTIYYTNVDVNENDQFLTLQTCINKKDKVFGEYDYPKADTRLVIVARAVRFDEDEDVDVSLAYLNENPKFPNIFYKYNKLDNPYIDDEKWYAKEVINSD